MRLDGLSRSAVDGQDILRAGGKRDQQIHLRPQPNIAPGHRPWRRCETKRAVRRPGNVHEQIKRTWHFRWNEAEFAHSGKEVIRAVVVMTLDPEERVAVAVAGGDQRVVDSP